MLNKDKYPVSEFDTDPEGLLSPFKLQKKYGALPTDKLIITFFKDVIKKLLDEGRIKELLTVSGENDLVIYKYTDCDTLLVHGHVGCPACGGFLEDAIGLGVRRVMFCGGGGVLDRSIGVGEILVVEGAIRDEGFSYQYAEPSRVIYSQADVKEKICKYLSESSVPYLEGLVWTTDAIYRETRERIKARREEGARIVEMEQAGCIAVAQFRGIKYGAMIYGGDDVSGEVWDSRGWIERKGVRYSLVEFCREILEII